MSKSSKRDEDQKFVDNDKDLADLKKYRIDPKNEAKYNETMRSLLNMSIDIKDGAERGDDVRIDEATSIIQKADELVRKSKCSSTAYLDAQILHNSALIYKNLVEKMDSQNSEFKLNEFAEKLVIYTSNSSESSSWKCLEDEASLMFRSAAGCSWLLGTIDVQEQQVPHRVRTKIRENVSDVPLKKPDEVKYVEKTSEDLDTYMKVGMNLIAKWEKSNKEPLQFWLLVLNPDSFSETIENIFIVSHLVKERLVYVGLDRDGLPVIKSIRKDLTASGSSNSSSIPVAVTIDMEQWEKMIKVFEITEPMFPTRGHAVTLSESN